MFLKGILLSSTFVTPGTMSRIFLLMLILFSNHLFAQQVARQDTSLKKQPHSNADSLINLWQMKSMMLDEVNIKGMKNYKTDSLNRRKEYASIFAYKGLSVLDVFVKKSPERPKQYSAFQNATASIASINVLQVFGLFKNNSSSASKLKKALLREEAGRFVDQRFSKEKIMAMTSLRGDSLESFMNDYRPTTGMAQMMNDYEMLMYIKTSYAGFRKAKPRE
jgi:hypothetical protein